MADESLVVAVHHSGGFYPVKTDMTANSDENLVTQKAIVTEVADKIADILSGQYGWGLLRVAANVVDGQTVTIGTDVFEVDIINTDSTDDTAGGDFNNTTDPITIDTTTYTNLATVVLGNLLRVENEILKVTNVHFQYLTLARGRCGTTAAAHANGQNIYTSNAAPASNIPVGLVTTLTPAVFTDALADEINSGAGASDQSGSVTATGISDNEVLIVHDTASTDTLATTETLAGTNNVWTQGTTTVAGRAASDAYMHVCAYVPTSADVTLDYFYVPLAFTPTFYFASVRVTATGAAKAWDGYTTYEAGPPKRLKISNEGSTDWSANDTVFVVAIK